MTNRQPPYVVYAIEELAQGQDVAITRKPNHPDFEMPAARWGHRGKVDVLVGPEGRNVRVRMDGQHKFDHFNFDTHEFVVLAQPERVDYVVPWRLIDDLRNARENWSPLPPAINLLNDVVENVLEAATEVPR